MKRFQDENKFLGSFMDEIFVKCPKCSCQAFVRRKFESKYASSDSKFFECKHCFYKLENPVYEYIAYGNPYCNNCYEKYEFKSQMLKEIPKVYRAKCPHCNYQEAWKPKILEYFKPMSLEDGMVKDDYFYLTVWFQVSFGDQIFWALNYDHIDYLKRYIQADLRERNSNIAYSASLVSRLPKFVKEAKNREKLLKILEKWKKIIQITAGRGPAECTWVVAQVLKKVLEEAQEQSLETVVLQRETGSENGTVETATLSVKGKNADEFAKSWLGTIQWIGQSQFRKMHKRKNWFIGIFEIEKQKNSDISEKDILYQAMRSSGAGGQHVNKVSSAIRATHVPTGIAVVAMDSRSQHQNKKLATERLLKKLEGETLQQLKNHVGKQWENQLNIQRGNPTRTFTGTDFKKNKIEKSYKGIRQKLKIDLRHENN